MIEKRIKDEYKLKQREGITELPDCFYIKVRITGIGRSLRQVDNNTILAERSPSDFLNSEFLEHAKTLPILENHPANNQLLNSENLNENRIIGNCIEAWIENDEVWGLARVFDKTLLSKLGNEIQSTSPGVSLIFDNQADPDIYKEYPLNINHLAFVYKGHWDSQESPIAFDNSKIEKLDYQNIKNYDIIAKNENDILLSKLDNDIENQKERKLMPKENEVLEKVAEAVENLDTAEAKKEVEAVKDETLPAETKEAVLEKVAEALNNTEADATEAILKEKEIADEAKEEVEKEVDTETKKADDAEVLHVLNKGEKEDETLNDENETEEDKLRDKAVCDMRAVCDKAHASLNVKMPFLQGRSTLRAVAYKFLNTNKQFVNSKYANLTLDSYTNDLALEVLNDTYNNIAKQSKDLSPKIEGFVDTGKGYRVYKDFGWSNK